MSMAECAIAQEEQAPSAPAESPDAVTKRDREVGLAWLGKKQARISIPKPHLLEPVPEHSDLTERGSRQPGDRGR
jgi:hypothetical protein